MANTTKRGAKICERENCGLWTQPRRYRNSCTALTEVPEGECPFYKSKWELYKEKQERKERIKKDPDYKSLCDQYDG